MKLLALLIIAFLISVCIAHPPKVGVSPQEDFRQRLNVREAYSGESIHLMKA